MALKNCKECGQEVSSEAKVCPHCGKRLRKWNWFLLIFVPLAFFLLVGYKPVLDSMKRLELERAQEYEESLYSNATILRSSYKDFTVLQAQSMSNISIREKTDCGFNGYSTINHSYELKSINGDKVIIDYATALMWDQLGSDEYMSMHDAKNWVRLLNRWGYAGYDDWRLPTLEEAASLLESDKRNHFYIDPIFSNNQNWVWTGDSDVESRQPWGVDFSGNGPLGIREDYGSGGVCNAFARRYVRPVRSMISSARK